MQEIRVAHVVFWQSCLSHHQSAFIRALAFKPGVAITLVVEEKLPKWREEMGWSVPDFGKAEIVVGPDRAIVNRLLKEHDLEAVHIFSPNRSLPMVWGAFHQALQRNLTVGILSEAYKWLGPIGMIRLARGRIDARLERNRVNFVLAIGHTAARWFRMMSYPESKIYPFGYFPEKPDEINDSSQPRSVGNSSKTVDLIFIGRFVHYKGVDVLLRALGELTELDWRLRIVGDGPERQTLEKLSTKLGISHRTHFLGSQDNAAAMCTLAKSDLLVLPCRGIEGWGAVVNEALQRGVPVICTDLCGAADLVRSHERGRVVQAGSTAALRDAVEVRIRMGKRSEETTSIIREWSANIDGEAVAGYLLDVFDAALNQKPKPTPPWW